MPPQLFRRLPDDTGDQAADAPLNRLSPREREILGPLALAAGLITPEVAEILGKTTGEVKALKHRGLASLARVLGLQSPDQTPDHPYPSPDPDHLASQEKHQG
jgi:DNA-directed RNA polymerase specialized sigma24 family protein